MHHMWSAVQEKMATMVKHLASLAGDRLILSFAPSTPALLLLKRIGEFFPKGSKVRCRSLPLLGAPLCPLHVLMIRSALRPHSMPTLLLRCRIREIPSQEIKSALCPPM